MKPALILSFLLAAASFSHAAGQPNILFIFSDDQSHDTLGTPDIETPHLDRLAAAGTTFTHAYNMGSWSGAVCVASRAMLISGRSLWRAKAMEQRQEQDGLWPQMMAGAGYETYFTGKWHIRTNAAKAFDHFSNIRSGMPRDTAAGYNRPQAGLADPWSPSDPKFGGFWAGGKHWSEVTGDDAVDFLGRAKESQKPFFMYIAFNAPHDPRQAPAEYVDKYPLDQVAVPENYLPEYPHKDLIGCGPELRDEKLAPFPRDGHAVKVHRQEYHAIISHMDAQIGRILDALEQSGKAANTWIIFTSDHGLAVGRHGLMGKQNMYDHSLRVPLILSGPGVKAGGRIAAPVYLQDVMATSLDIAGIEKPPHVEFHSLRSLLDGKSSPAARESIYGAYLDLQRAVIHDGWKLILYPQAKVARLYNLLEDPLEMNDLANDPTHAPRRAALLSRFSRLQKDFDDPLEVGWMLE